MLPLVAQIPPPPTSGFSLGPLDDIRFYGILIATGAYLALRLTVSRYERLGGDPALAERTALWALGAGFLGARLGYVLPRLDQFADRPLAVLAIWEGGLALFGGLFLGSVVALLLLRRWHADTPAFADAIAPALPLAQAIGRWGNYFNQELYGRPTDLPWAVEIEPRFRRPGFEEVATFHPTFLYESLANAVLVVVLLRLDRTGRLRRGALMWVYATGYGVIRALTESLRIDTAERYLGLSRNNWIAIAIAIVGAVGLWWWQTRRQPTTQPATPQAADDQGGDEGEAEGDDEGEDEGAGEGEDHDPAAEHG